MKAEPKENVIIEPRENSDLLEATKEQNGNVDHEEAEKGPPDGGLRAYLVVLGSFLTNGLLFGVINSYSVINVELKEKGASEAKAALVGGLTMGSTFFLSPVSGVLTSILGLRMTAVLGGSIATASLILSSFVASNVDALCFTYGILYGMGASFAYTPSLAVLGHYFKKHLGLVNGVVTIGSSVFTVFIPMLMKHMINNYGLDWMFRILAIFAFGVALCGLLFKPIPLTSIKPIREDNNCKSLLKSIIDTEIWKNRKYRIWALSMPVALFGYFVPYVHIKAFIKSSFPDVDDLLPLQCIAITSGLGRLFFGFLADKPGMNRVLLQQISFYVIGTLTIILPFVKFYWLLVVVSLGIGLCDGAFIALIGPIAIEFCGPSFAAQAIGCMLGLAAPPLSIGPMVASYLLQIQNNYTIPFVLAGISPLVGATLMFTIWLPKNTSGRPEGNGHAVAMSSADNDAEKLPLSNGHAKHQTLL